MAGGVGSYKGGGLADGRSKKAGKGCERGGEAEFKAERALIVQ